jgi:hypothetical protein
LESSGSSSQSNFYSYDAKLHSPTPERKTICDREMKADPFPESQSSNASETEITRTTKKSKNISPIGLRTDLLFQTFLQGLIQPLLTQHTQQAFTSHLSPFGMYIPDIEHTKFLRVCMQNTQHSFQIYGDGLELTSTIDQLKNIGVSMFSAISPNINWHNYIHWI